MKSKKLWLGILVMVLVFGISVIGCEEGVCPDCDGTGKCPICKGAGQLLETVPGISSRWVDCGRCNGSGECRRCNGNGIAIILKRNGGYQ